MNKKSFFSENLLQWYKPESRPLPWKGIKNPYYIWLSEIILQQTRVAQGLPYYLKFTENYPTVCDLAAASEDEVLKLWEGLGYYSRARNLHSAAKDIAEKRNGIFPETYADIRTLKGVGDYTASAIASFAYNLPHAVIDGNVYRVLARYFGIGLSIDRSEGKNKFRELADSLLNKNQPGLYNQAIMDFGATQCTPSTPDCSKCPFITHCSAYSKGEVNKLPVKTKKIKKKDRYFYYLILKRNEQVLLGKRDNKDIWAGLYEFPLVETDKKIEKSKLAEILRNNPDWNYCLTESDNSFIISETFKQTLTHQKINAVFIETECTFGFNLKTGYKFVLSKSLSNYAFPKIIRKYLETKTTDFP